MSDNTNISSFYFEEEGVTDARFEDEGLSKFYFEGEGVTTPELRPWYGELIAPSDYGAMRSSDGLKIGTE